MDDPTVYLFRAKTFRESNNGDGVAVCVTRDYAVAAKTQLTAYQRATKHAAREHAKTGWGAMVRLEVVLVGKYRVVK